MSPRWENLAIALKFDGPVIESTKMNAHFQVDRACQSILQRWLEGATMNVDPKLHVTWETLLGCLEDVGMNMLAKNLRSELLP